MTLPPQADTNPQRSATRAPVEVAVRVQFDDSLEVHTGKCYNISIGGMFLEIEQVRPHGSLVRFEVGLEEGSVRGLAEVVWSQGPLPGRAGGLGLKFRFLEQRDRQLIFKLVSQHIKDRLAQRPSLADEPPPSPNTALARQRRASLLGEGVPVPTPPPLAVTSSIPRPQSGVLPAAAPVPAPAPTPAPAGTSLSEAPSPWAATTSPVRVMDQRFPSTPVADDLVVRTGASPLPILDDLADEAPPRFPTPPAPARGLEERTWPSARTVDPAWLTPDPDGELDLPMAPAAASDDLGFARPAAPSAPFDAEIDEPEERHYFDHLDGPGHEAAPRRPVRSRRSFPWIVLPLLLILALLGYFLGTRLWHRSAEAPPAEDQEEVLRIGTSQGGAAPSLPPASTPPRVEPPPAEPTVEPEVRPDDGGSGAATPADPTPAPARGPEPRGDDAAPPEESPDAATPPIAVPDPPPATPAPADRAFRRLVDIRWNKIPEGVEVILETDGALPDQRWDKFRLEGATPREVIRFYGVEKRFEAENLVVGSIYLQQIRLGWHTNKPKGNELHVVLDVGGNGHIAQVKKRGNALVVQVKKR